MSRPAGRPTFAVIVAAYQGADVIGEALESVLAQTLQPEEIVVCDDGSTDDLAGALAPFGSRVALIRKENGGAASALNAAARAASSEFVVQLDQDDAFTPDRLDAIAELAGARPDLDVIATDAVMELAGQPVARYNELNPFAVDDQRAATLRSCFFGWPAIRRERLLSIGGFDETLRVTWDWDCWSRLILSGSLVGLVDEPLYRWRLNPGSLSSEAAKNARENVVVLEKLLGQRSLSPEERAIAEEGLRIHTRRAVLLEAKEALLAGRADARRLALHVAAGSGFSAASRLKAALSVLAPGLSRRLMQRRIAASPTGGMDLADR